MNRKQLRKRGLWLCGGLASILVLGYFGICAYSAEVLTRIKREPLQANPGSYQTHYENVEFLSATDHLKLRGWWLPAAQATARVIIMVHGKAYHRANPDIGMLPLGTALAKNYNVLMFDLRGYGESAGERFSLGQFEQRDVDGAVAYVRQRGYARGNIGVIGWSMGAATSLLCAAHNPDIAAVVADSSFAALPAILNAEIPKESGLPRCFNWGIIKMAKLRYGVDVYQIRPAQAAAKLTQTPVLLIHCPGDKLIPVTNAFQIYQQLPNGKQAPWLLSPGDHCEAYKLHPVAYIRGVSTFFNQHLAQ